MKVGSLFSGIGGIDLGLERAGMRIIWQSEIEPYACRVLSKHWPDIPNLGDITTVDWSSVERPDLICGGYPCQPFSFAGVRRGEADPRHLWPHFANCIRQLRPDWVLLENVPGHLSMGFGRVLADLAALGYRSEWDCIPAAAVGAPHLRYRVFVVATTTAHADTQSEPRSADNGDTSRLMVRDRRSTIPNAARTRRTQAATLRLSVAAPRRVLLDTGMDADAAQKRRNRRAWPDLATARWTQPPYSRWWSVEPDVGRVAHGVPHRMDRLHCLGNAVVPQVAQLIGTAILDVVANATTADDE